MSKWTDRLLIAVQEIAEIIYYQMPIRHQDRWLQRIIDEGLWEEPDDK